MVGDWNGDGIDTVGVFRPSTGQWLLTNSLNINNSTPPIDLTFNFGSAGDTPVAGDWDGDGRDSIGVFNGDVFSLRNSNWQRSCGRDLRVWYCRGFAILWRLGWRWHRYAWLVAEWNHVPSQQQLYRFADLAFNFGQAGDLPIAGDWDFKPGNTAPNSGVNNPSDGLSAAGQVQTFVTTCSDPDGWHDIATIDFKIARSNGNGQGIPIAIWAQFDENRNLIRLYDPDLQIWREVRPDRNLSNT